MKRIGIIDNLLDLQTFDAAQCSAADYSAFFGGNTGNLAFVLGTNLSIGNTKIRIGWDWDVSHVKSLVDHIVICCANQVGEHVSLDQWEDRLKQFNLPVTLIGLGAQTTNYEKNVSVPSGTVRFLQTVSALRSGSASNIGVRGSFSQEVLNRIGIDSQITGCPSLFISPDLKLGDTIVRNSKSHKERRIAVAAGNPFHAESCLLDERLMEIVERTKGAYIIQHPEELIALAIGKFEDKHEKYLDIIKKMFGKRFDLSARFAKPSLIDRLLKGGNTLKTINSKTDLDLEFFQWFRQHSYVFSDAVVWMNFLKSFNGMIGPRYHGVAFAVQAGVPSTVIHIDNRTQELSESSAIKNISTKEFMRYSFSDALKSADWEREEGEAFDRNRLERAKIMLGFLRSNNLQESSELAALATCC